MNFNFSIRIPNIHLLLSINSNIIATTTTTTTTMATSKSNPTAIDIYNDDEIIITCIICIQHDES